MPYCVVSSKARLGQLVHMKTATAVAFTGVRREDEGAFAKLVEAVRANYNERFDETRRQWGGGILGPKAQARIAKHEAAVRREEAKRMGR